ncbi:YczE/YyaS/YitT family protein [Cellulomonas marina]|uniref:Uncharacterized membrane protein YczE n=1 Tax=Cellulomonas marina TaxID=988821 RepID=A0A1I0W132_9CELL|nr:hypothetical protein [Cellulomonas marina]GIG27441.1 membrane protein [Cellulomonas marina]SFA81803.1 Uncharacterized membrane protein YczE [Cellulomonas marina]
MTSRTSPASPPAEVGAARSDARPDARVASWRTDARGSAQLVVGLLLYALSMAVMVRAGLGALPWDVLTQGLTHRLPLSFGAITALTSLVVLLCWWPLRQRPGLGTVANVVVIALAVDPALALVGLLPPLGLPARVALVVVGIVLNAVATALYIGVGLGPGPRDGLMTGLVGRTGWPLAPVRIGIEVAVVGVGALLGGTLGLATLAYALGVGPLVHVLLPRLTRPGVRARH